MPGQALVRADRHDGGVVLLTLADPDRRNAMSTELTAAWTESLRTVGSDPALRCLVVTGAGAAFCAGGDLGWIAGSADRSVGELRDRMLPFYREWLAVRELPVPTVAAVNGSAIGAGLCLALACDLRYGGRRTRLSAPFTRLGMHPGMAASFLLTEAVGAPRARELLFTGRTVDADEAVRLGLLHAVVADEELVGHALSVAGRIAEAAPLATRLTKAALADGGPRSVADALGWEGLAQPVTMAGADLAEGLAAARANRPPRFTGR